MAVADEFKKEAQFKTYWHHRKPGFWFRKDRDRPEGIRDFPEVVRFDVDPGVPPSSKPPVRIFLGTEPSQYRAERVFIWSVKQVRDPARVYEIYIMKDLKGYDRRGWKTGFTNYRYAIPAMAGGQGRAIYNDVDQVYLSDPAELFDLEMDGAGILGITGRETSVLLIDCEKMATFWSIDEAKAGRKHRYFRDITHGNNLWGQLPGEWNARDEEFEQGKSKCFHFTTLQTQPWQPFPDQLLYKPHPDGEVWFALERAADEAGYTPFTKERPSRRFTEMLEQYRILHEQGEQTLELEPQQTFSGKSLARHLADIGKLCGRHGASSLLDYGCGKALFYDRLPGEPDSSRLRRHAQLPGVTVTCYDPGYKPFSDPYEGPFDGVISTDVLEHIPEEDIGWVLDEIFGAARKFVYVVAACYPARKTLPNGENAHCTLLSPEWWAGQLETAARRKPGVHWTLCTIEKTRIGKRRRLQDGTGAQRQAA
ncbi:class I SAM-dependent methyltransferase [Limibacillus sp. MBR-115]|uniref:class I SAM-dependent methyltransferase n=1 Tax=Limibacillus sp. MBR-115 TaxID=3156465 RepID=UPI00339B1D0D